MLSWSTISLQKRLNSANTPVVSTVGLLESLLEVADPNEGSFGDSVGRLDLDVKRSIT